MRARDYRLGGWVWVVCLFFNLWPVPCSGAETVEGVIWVSMTGEFHQRDVDGVSGALALRLPGFAVRTLSSGESIPACGEDIPNGYWVALTREGARLTVSLRQCRETKPRFSETMVVDEKGEAYRKSAILVALVVTERGEADAPTEAASREATSDAAADRPSNGSPSVERLRATIGLLPGTTIAPTAGAGVFSAGLEAGVLWTNHLWLTAGAEFSTPHKGTADKNANNDANDIAISVRDVDLSVAAGYRIALGTRWWLALGAALSYTHFIKKDLADDKFTIEESAPSARGAVSPTGGVGFAPLGFMSIVLRVNVNIAFGRRTFKVRGVDALDLGMVSTSMFLGVVFLI